ncbi:TerB family tellurite resistance protein [uncultured Kordia sp.]|uniref:TerB family tellurite resistance protein n=1 Tax=uncultured Kordia sp. TaxID=507699 RepID=UPI002639633D|nr:TerB family tellurite resistance protein [uncultured Kordia sp.]
MSSQNAHSRSQYHDAFSAIMKITFRDGDTTEDEKVFLKYLATKLGISDAEYKIISDNYMDQAIEAPYTYNERLENFYKVVQVIYEDKDIEGKNQSMWLERMAKAMGFNPSNVQYIVAKSLTLFRDGTDLAAYKEAIKNMNT